MIHQSAVLVAECTALNTLEVNDAETKRALGKMFGYNDTELLNHFCVCGIQFGKSHNL